MANNRIISSVQHCVSMPSHMASVASIGEEDCSWPTNKSNSILSISHHRGKGHITPIMHNVVGGATTSGMPVTGLVPDIQVQSITPSEFQDHRK